MKSSIATPYIPNATCVFLAFLYASLLASFITGLAFYIPVLYSSDHGIGWENIEEFIYATFGFSFSSMIIWTPCIVLLGGPIWWLFHILNWRNYIHFALLGGAIPFIAIFVFNYFMSPLPLDSILYIALIFGAIGVPSGLLIWKTAYY